nr:reverse transcriptase domain-containing protein [Tanacetum cinerariifolium]
MQEETKKRSSQSLQARLNFDPEYEASPPRHRKERRERDSRRPPVFTRIGKKVVGDQTANLQYLGTYENNGWHTNVHARLGSRDFHDRLGQQRSLSEMTPRTTRMKKRDTGNPGTDTVTRRTTICLVHGVAKRSTRLLGASVIFQKIREGACLLISKLMMGQEHRWIRRVVEGIPPEFYSKEEEKPPLRTAKKATQVTSHGSSPGDNPMTRVAIATIATAIKGAAGRMIKGHDIHSMYIDGGASVDILYEHYFQRLPPEVKRQIRLLVIVGNEEHSTTTWMTFMVIRSPSPYNGIIGRPGISAIRAVLSTAHRMLKFPVDGGIITIYNTTVPPRECNTVACDATQTQTQHAAKVINLKVAIHPDYPEQEVSIGGRCLTEAGWRCGDFRWTTEAEEVFTQLKQHIATLPTLVAPRPGEELIMYLSATHGAISAVLLTDWNSVQTLVYFILADFIIEKPDTNVAPPRSKVPRSENKKVNALSNIASISFAHLLKQVQVEILKNKPISEMEISTMIEEQNPTWMTLIIEFISKGTLPHKQTDVRRIRRKAQRFELQDGILYQRLFLQLWLQCVGPLQADYVLREIHAGSCSMHSGPRSVVARALRSGYYWPTMHRDARDVIKKCSDCQVHRPIPRQPQQQLTPITSPCLFYKWGIYIASPFPVAAGGLKFLIVAIDYFTKWIEA